MVALVPLYSSIQSGEPNSGWEREVEFEETTSLITRACSVACPETGKLLQPAQRAGNKNSKIKIGRIRRKKLFVCMTIL